MICAILFRCTGSGRVCLDREAIFLIYYIVEGAECADESETEASSSERYQTEPDAERRRGSEQEQVLKESE